MSYELALEKFKGPLEKLLELIEEKKLDINDISLAQVTDDFLNYLALIESEVAHEEGRGLKKDANGVVMDLRLIADFIVVASRLLLIKSRSLLPEFSLTGEEEADVKDLEWRLARYRELKSAEKYVARLWQEGHRTWSRPYFFHLASSSPVFYPAKNINGPSFREAFAKLIETLEHFSGESETIKETIISLEEKMEEVIRRIRGAAETTLGTLSKERSRGEVIALFLAILHLAREELVFLEQREHFSDIIIRKREQEAR